MNKRKQLSILLGALGIALIGGFGSCNSVAAYTAYTVPIVKPEGFENHPYGGFGLGAALDTTYTRFDIDYYPFVKPGSQETQAINYDYGISLKYPIELDKITVSPMAGLHPVIGGLTIGASLDVPLSGKFSFNDKLSFHAETFYGFGQSGSLFLRAGVAYKLDNSGWTVGVYRQFVDKTLAIEDHAKIMLSSYVHIARIDDTNTDIQLRGLGETWVVLPPGKHVLTGFRMSSVDLNRTAPETSGKDETGGENYLYYFRSLDVNNNGLQDSWIGTALLEKGHYYLLRFQDDGLAPTLVDITSMSGFSDDRKKLDKKLRIK
jgi:hypothetical protein